LVVGWRVLTGLDDGLPMTPPVPDFPCRQSALGVGFGDSFI